MKLSGIPQNVLKSEKGILFSLIHIHVCINVVKLNFYYCSSTKWPTKAEVPGASEHLGRLWVSGPSELFETFTEVQIPGYHLCCRFCFSWDGPELAVSANTSDESNAEKVQESVSVVDQLTQFWIKSHNF
jgi:hypothetical protein